MPCELLSRPTVHEVVEGCSQALGRGSVSCKVIKELALYCTALCCSGFALNNTFGLCAHVPTGKFL